MIISIYAGEETYKLESQDKLALLKDALDLINNLIKREESK